MILIDRAPGMPDLSVGGSPMQCNAMRCDLKWCILRMQPLVPIDTAKYIKAGSAGRVDLWWGMQSTHPSTRLVPHSNPQLTILLLTKDVRYRPEPKNTILTLILGKEARYIFLEKCNELISAGVHCNKSENFNWCIAWWLSIPYFWYFFQPIYFSFDSLLFKAQGWKTKSQKTVQIIVCLGKKRSIQNMKIFI